MAPHHSRISRFEKLYYFICPVSSGHVHDWICFMLLCLFAIFLAPPLAWLSYLVKGGPSGSITCLVHRTGVRLMCVHLFSVWPSPFICVLTSFHHTDVKKAQSFFGNDESWQQKRFICQSVHTSNIKVSRSLPLGWLIALENYFWT